MNQIKNNGLRIPFLTSNLTKKQRDSPVPWGRGRRGEMSNRDQKWVMLHIGHLVGPNRMAWNDFCIIKNLKYPVFPIITMGCYAGEKCLNTKYRLKID